MRTYYTPNEVAKVLARHAPKNTTSILEPSVGDGILLEQLIKRFNGSLKHVVCIDKNKDAIKTIEKKYKPILGNILRIEENDFFYWAPPLTNKGLEIFDCIIMNPPFSGRTENWLDIGLLNEFNDINTKHRSLPIELLFILRAIKLLKYNGRLLAVVPSSLVSWHRTRWLREYILNFGAVKYVHELPKFTFSNVEARIYLFIFQKSAKQNYLTTYNHDLIKKNKLIISKNDLYKAMRFDHSYYFAYYKYENLIKSTPELGWTKLDEIATILRGKIGLTSNDRNAVHTCDYKDGFWFINKERRNQMKKGKSDTGVQANDILITRIGRNCTNYLGMAIRCEGYSCSDCILIIRPNINNLYRDLLLALRVLLTADVGSKLLERGMGVTYITKADLFQLYVPIKIAQVMPKLFSMYCKALKTQKSKLIRAIEFRIQKDYCF